MGVSTCQPVSSDHWAIRDPEIEQMVGEKWIRLHWSFLRSGYFPKYFCHYKQSEDGDVDDDTG